MPVVEILTVREEKRRGFVLDFIAQSADGGADNDVSALRAIQDIGCQNAAKFFYYFPIPIALGVIRGFVDCDIVTREFSKIIPSAKDLVRIKRKGEFSADFVIGGTRAVVYFNGSAKRLPQEAIATFAERLRTVGYKMIVYSDGLRPQCNRCPARHGKGCVGVGAS